MAYEKRPAARLDYTFDWSSWLEGGDTITAATVTVTNSIVLDKTDRTDTKVVAWISGGTPGRTCRVVCRIETAAGRRDERTAWITVINR